MKLKALKEGTAPEHIRNEGRPLNEGVVFEPMYQGPAYLEYDIDPAIVPAEMNEADFALARNEFASLFSDPPSKTITERRIKAENIPVRSPVEAVQVDENTWEIPASDEINAMLSNPKEHHGYGDPKGNNKVTIKKLGDKRYEVSSNYNNAYDHPHVKVADAMFDHSKMHQFRETRTAGVIQSNSKKTTDADVLERAIKEAQALSFAIDTGFQYIDKWTNHAIDQRETGENYNKVILSLFDLSGAWGQPFADAGYNVIPIDIQSGLDIFDINAEYLYDFMGVEGDIYGILAACPCTDFASAGAKHFKAKDADGRTETSKELVFKTLDLIEELRPEGFWILENPVGRIERLTGLPKARMSFQPYHFGEAYTKQTQLWGNFNAKLPLMPVEPVLGSAMWSKYGGKSQATKNARSVTPEGFAYSFFMANNHMDLSPEERLSREYPGVQGAVHSALKAGLSEKEIVEAIDDPHLDDGEDQAIENIGLAISEKTGDEKTKKAILKKKEDAEAQAIADADAAEKRWEENEARLTSTAKLIMKYTNGTGLVRNLTGDSNKKARQEILSTFLGEKVTLAKSGVNRLFNELLYDFDAEYEDTLAEQEKMLAENLKGYIKEEPKFSRTTKDSTTRKYFTTRQVTTHAENLMEGWKGRPPVRVVRNESKLPQEIQNHIRKIGASGTVDGVYWRGKAYVIADRMRSAKHIEQTVFEEALGHHGLRGMLGSDLNPVLDQVWRKYGRSNLSGVIERYFTGDNKFDINNASHRRLVAEEHLTDLIQQDKAPPSLMKRLYAAVRQWLRNHGFTRLGVAENLSDSEIDVLLSNAKDFVKNGKVVRNTSMLPAFSRAPEAPLSSKWFDERFIANPDDRENDVVKAFNSLGEKQRGKPEMAMLKAQKALGGGVMSFAVEHGGDLTHRMTAAYPHNSYGYEYFADKVDKLYRTIHSGYGFEKEHMENLKSNASYDKVSLEEYTSNAKDALNTYADEHSKLPVYNETQWLARQFAISLGKEDIDSAKIWISRLKRIVEDRDNYIREASKYYTTKDGDLAEYNYSLIEKIREAKKARKDSESLFSRTVNNIKNNENFQKWFGDSKVVDENGEPLEVYHGTTRDWTVFDKSKGALETDWGRGAYFSNTIEDADTNYAGEGPDLTSRLEHTAEGLHDYIEENLEEYGLTEESDYDEIHEIALEEARKELTDHQGMIIPAYLSFQNPVIYGLPMSYSGLDQKETVFTYSEPYDEKLDEWNEPEGTLVDYFEALDEAALDFDMSDSDLQSIKTDILENAMDYGEISVTEMVELIKNNDAIYNVFDYEGGMGGSELVRRSFEYAGFDGIIDNTVPQKFGPARQFGVGMAGMDYSTVHYIAFNPNQIKSSIGNNGDYSMDNDDIRFSITAPMDRMRSAADAVKSIDLASNGVTQAVKSWVKRNFTKEGWTNEPTFESRIKMHSLKNVGESEVAALTRDLEKSASTAFGVKRYDQIADDKKDLMNSYLVADDEGKAEIAGDLPDSVVQNLDVLRDQVDRLSNGMLDAIRDMLRIQRGKLSARLQDQFDTFVATNGKEGSIPQAMQKHFNLYQKISANKGQYLNRSYQAFDDPEWLETVKKDTDLMERAKDFMREQMLEADAKRIAADMRFDPEAYGFTEKTKSAEIQEAAMERAVAALKEEDVVGAVHGIVQDALDQGTFLNLVAKGSKEGSKDVSILMKRKDVPPVIRELLGEYLDPKVNFIRTATKMNWYIANHHFLMDLRNKGLGKFIFDRRTTNDTGDFSAKLAEESSEPMNPLNGTFSTVEYRQGLTDALNKFDGSDLMRQIIAMNSVVKYGKTILAPTTQFRNFMSAAMFSVMNGHFDWSHAGTAARVAKSDMFTKNAEWRKYIEKLIGLGVLHDNPYAGELRDAIKDYTDAYSLEGNAVSKKLKLGLDFFQRAYQIGDDFWKIIGYENELSSLLDTGMSRDEAEKKAAFRIRNGYPTYSMVPRGIKKIRRWPLIGTFVSFPYEIVRTTYNQMGFIKEDMEANPKQAYRRAAGMAVASSAAYAASVASMMMMGMDGEDDEAVRAQLPEWSRNAQLVYTGYDKNGMPTYIDLSYLDPYTYVKTPLSAFMNGNNEGFNEKMADALKSFLEPFIGADIAAGALGEILSNQKATGGTVYNPEDSDMGKTMSVLNHARKAVQPGIMSNMERTYKAIVGDASRSGKQYDIWDEGFAWIGWRFGTLNIPQSLIYKAYGFKDAKSQATRLLSYTAGSGANVSEGELERAVTSMINSRQESYTDMSKLVTGAMQLGMTRSEVYNTLRAANISKDDIKSLLSGKVPKWNMTSSFLKSASQRANISAVNNERRRELAAEMISRRRFINRSANEQYRR